jgi:hypothetical protein
VTIYLEVCTIVVASRTLLKFYILSEVWVSGVIV